MHRCLVAFPFLSEIPSSILIKIDLDALHIPSHSERQWINALSFELQKNIVVYKKGHNCNGEHLCRVLVPADLTDLQLSRLNVIERQFNNGQIVVAYEKPLMLAPPVESAF